jgi:transposase
MLRISCSRGVLVREVSCPDRSRRRRRGKSDPVDAENAARAVLSGEATAVLRDRGGAVGELRVLVITRRSAVKARTQASNQIKAFLLDAGDELRARLRPLSKARFARACAALDPADGLNRALDSPGRRWLTLDSEARELEKQINALVAAQAPALLDRHGAGPISAAQLLVTAGANPGRLRGDAALAALCGASPIEASSGKTSRHRLNRGGDRAANNALWTIAHIRMISDPRTRAYVAKRTATGNSRKEIMRILMRYIARELYPLIIDAFVPVNAIVLT